jgi:hypothetical protein
LDPQNTQILRSIRELYGKAVSATRITATQQIDVRAGFGLTREAPDHLFGLGYSFRFDHLL